MFLEGGNYAPPPAPREGGTATAGAAWKEGRKEGKRVAAAAVSLARGLGGIDFVQDSSHGV